MRKLVAVLTLCFACLAFSVPAYAGDKECKDDPRECIDGFEDDGTVIPKDPKVARTFSFPPIKAGFVVDFKHRDILPHISVEVTEFTLPRVGDFSVDVGVGNSRVFTSLVWEFIPLIKAGPSIWVGYNVKENDLAYGVGVSILNF